DPSRATGPEVGQGFEEFKNSLWRGREPWLSVQGQYFHQDGNNFALNGAAGSLDAKFNPTPFLTLYGQVGEGAYWTGTDYARDYFFTLGGQFRVHTLHQFDAQIGYHSQR